MKVCLRAARQDGEGDRAPRGPAGARRSDPRPRSGAGSEEDGGGPTGTRHPFPLGGGRRRSGGSGSVPLFTSEPGRGRRRGGSGERGAGPGREGAAAPQAGQGAAAAPRPGEGRGEAAVVGGKGRGHHQCGVLGPGHGTAAPAAEPPPARRAAPAAAAGRDVQGRAARRPAWGSRLRR